MQVFCIDEEKLKITVGVSSGIYAAARSPELGSVVRKLGFALTRGANAIEIAGDVPHEIDFTQGKEMRYIAEKQNLTLLFHGSLTVPMCMPERGEWRDAQNHLQKSIRYAVMGGCKYVNFHSCLNFWLEMMTYSGRKLTMSFCDHEGNFIGDILGSKGCEELRKWFIARKWDTYGGDILYNEERLDAQVEADRATDNDRRKMVNEQLGKELDKTHLQNPGDKENIIQYALTSGRIPHFESMSNELVEKLQQILDKIQEDLVKTSSDNRRILFQKKIETKLKDHKKKWDSEELRAVMGIIDGYHIMSHYLYYTYDDIWKTMEKMYKSVIDKYKTVYFAREDKSFSYSPGKSNGSVDYWLDAAWEQAERENDREFKEFYYSVCAAKYIEGHIKKTLEWMKSEAPDGMLGDIKSEVGEGEEYEKLKKIASELKITLEIPDARSPEYAGLYLICRPKQIYAAVKSISEKLKTDKLYMLIDFEHIATQGFDAYTEIKEFVKLAPDAGKYILSLHVTKPTPLHHHIQVDIGDVEIYKLLWELVGVGLGKHHMTYFIYERGGEQDPFKQSVVALRLMVDQLNQGTSPEQLINKPEFFGVSGPNVASEDRQRVIIKDHAVDPIDGLMVVPEESHTYLGKSAISKVGKEKWKKEELL